MKIKKTQSNKLSKDEAVAAAEAVAKAYVEKNEELKGVNAEKSKLAEQAKALGAEYGEKKGSAQVVITPDYEVGVLTANVYSFDEEGFKKAYPTLYAKYSKQVTVLDMAALKADVLNKKLPTQTVDRFIINKPQQRVVVKKKGLKDDSQEEDNIGFWGAKN